MNIEESAQQTSQPANEMYVQSSSNTKSFAVVILAILLLITLFIFGAYIYFEEIYQPNSEKSPSTVTTTQAISENAGYEDATLDLKTSLDIFNNQESNWKITKPIGSTLEYNANSYKIKGIDFEILIANDFFNEGNFLAHYNYNYTKLLHPYYGNLYRIQSDILTPVERLYPYVYINDDGFKEEGICTMSQDDTPLFEAPCGDSSLILLGPDQKEVDAVLNIICYAEDDMGLNECDKIVASLRKL